MSSSDPFYTPKQLLPTSVGSSTLERDVPPGSARQIPAVDAASRVESEISFVPRMKELAESGILISEVIDGHGHRSPHKPVRAAPAAPSLPFAPPPDPIFHSLHSHRQQDWGSPLEASADLAVRISAAEASSPDFAKPTRPGQAVVPPTRANQAPPIRNQIVDVAIAPVAPVAPTPIQTPTPPVSSSSTRSIVDNKRRAGSNSSRLRATGLPMVAEVDDPAVSMGVGHQRGSSSDTNDSLGTVPPLPTPPLWEPLTSTSSPQRTQIDRGNHGWSEDTAIFNPLTPEDNDSGSLDNGSGVSFAFIDPRIVPADEIITYQPRSMEEPVSPKEAGTPKEPKPHLTMVMETSTEYEYVYDSPDKIKFQSAEAYRWKVMQIAQSPTSDSGGAHQSVMITKERRSYECLLDISSLETGWYWIVVHLERSLYLERQIIQSLTIDAKQMDENGREASVGKTCRTNFMDFDLDNLFHADRSKHVRLHRQIEISSGKDLQLTVESDIRTDYADDCLMVHSIQLIRGLPDDRDLVVYGEGMPQDIIHIPQRNSKDGIPRITNVHAYSISQSRTHVATLSFNDDNFYIQVWDLQPPDGAPSPSHDEKKGRPQEHWIPWTDTVFEAKSTKPSELKDICFHISNLGQQVAIHSVEKGNDHGIQFKLFRYVPRIPISKTAGRLVPADSLASGLKEFCGYGCFHSQDEELTSKERYITCQGTQISVYSATLVGTWDHLYTLPLCVSPNLEAAQRLYSSLHGRYFAWTGSKDVVSIWDFETGLYISNIATPTEDNVDVYVNFSRSGKKVAISAPGKISVHQTHSGVLLGEYNRGLDEDSFYEVDFDEDYFMTIDQAESTKAKEKQKPLSSCRRIVDTRSDIAVQRTYWIHQNYELLGASGSRAPVFGYGQGSAVSVFTLPDPIAPAVGYRDHSDCDVRDVKVHRYGTISHQLLSEEGIEFHISSSQRGIRGVLFTVLEISRMGDNPKSMVLPLGPAISTYHGVCVAETTHLILVVGCYLQRWSLLTTGPEVCKLDLVWEIENDSAHPKDICMRQIISAGVYRNGREVLLQIGPPQWFRRRRRIVDDEMKVLLQNDCKPQDVMVPYSKYGDLPWDNRAIRGTVGALCLYSESDMTLSRYVIHYLASMVRQSQEHGISSIVCLAKVWTPELRVPIEGVLRELLSLKRYTWVPDTFSSKENDPLSILMETTERQPSAIGAARVILDYCVHHAINSRNLSFLSPLFFSIHELMNMFPEDASEYLSRIAFIPAQQRSFIIDNHLVIRPPKALRIPFLEEKPIALHANIKDPILQLVVTPPRKEDPANDTFTRPVFMTSFDALWTYPHENKHSRLTDTPMTKAICDNYEDDRAKRERRKLSWIKTGFHMIGYKCQFKSRTYVKTHEFNSLEYFDNPAIAALVAYKWNTIGYSYWFFRFMSQCVFYALVYFAALFQVYDRENPNQPIGHFIAILVVGAGFLWLELLQLLHNPVRYRKSMYNILDLVAYGLPMIASIDQLIIHQMDDVQGNTRILSFSILVVFFHMLFEARVNEGICKYVTIIQEAIVEIKVFLLIFTAGLLGFAVAILHLMHGRYPMGTYNPKVDDVGTKYPYNFLGALSATYFFMGGIYDSVSDNFEEDDWAFHLMMAICFFFTVILMLNVLIALINVAFIKGDDDWRLVWIQSRLQYIEAVENMSYYLPGFRFAHDQYFPKVIYFTATWKEVRDYKLKYEKRKKEGSAVDEMTKHLNEQDAPVRVASVVSAVAADEPIESLDARAKSPEGYLKKEEDKKKEKVVSREEEDPSTVTMESLFSQMQTLTLMMQETQSINNAMAAKIFTTDRSPTL